MTVRVGIVGCGHIGTVHSFALGALVKAGLVDAAVTATQDVDHARAEATAAHHGATAHRDVESLLGSVDAVWVCTWTAAHLDVVSAAADRGLAVFCEKPLAPSLAECQAVAAQLERVPHQVGLVLRHAPVFREVAQRVADGRHGRVLAAILRDDQYFPIQGMYGSDWRADVGRAGGGTLIEHSIHDVDVLRWILGDPESVQAHVTNMFGHPGIDDGATVALSYPDGSHATLVSIWHQVLSRPSTRRLEVFCEEAFLWTEDDYLGPLHIETADGGEVVTAEPPEWASRFELPEVLAKPLAQYAEPTKAFLDAIALDGAAAVGSPDAATALAAHRIVELAYRSAAAGTAPRHGDSASPR